MGLHFLSGSFVAEVTQPSGLWALWSGYFLQEGLHQRRHSQTAAASPLCPCDEPLLTHTSTGYPPTLAGSFGSVSCGVTALFLWVLVHARFCLCPARVQSPFSPVLWKSCNQILLAFPVRKIPWVFSVPLLGPQARSLTCGFKPSQRWVIFCIIVLHFVGYPPGGYRIWFYRDVPLLPSPAISSLSLGMEYLSLVGSSIFLSVVVQQLVVILVLLQEEMSRILLLLHLEPEALDMLSFTCRSFLGCDSEGPSPLSVWLLVCLFNFSTWLLVMTLSSICLSIHVKYRSSENRISVSNTKFNSDSLPACLVTKMYPTLCNPMDCSLPGSSVHGFPRQEYWNGLAYPGNLPDPGSNLSCLHLLIWKADYLPLAAIPQKRTLILKKDFSKDK